MIAWFSVNSVVCIHSGASFGVVAFGVGCVV